MQLGLPRSVKERDRRSSVLGNSSKGLVHSIHFYKPYGLAIFRDVVVNDILSIEELHGLLIGFSS